MTWWLQLLFLIFLEYEREPCLKAKAGTLHPHPDDCKKFIQCISLNRGEELTCATNLVYDPDAKTCIYPKNDLICPDILPCLQKSNGYFAHPFNCSLYIQCESGREKIQTCSPGLIWVPSVNSCMYPSETNSCKDEVVTWHISSGSGIISYYCINIIIIITHNSFFYYRDCCALLIRNSYVLLLFNVFLIENVVYSIPNRNNKILVDWLECFKSHKCKFNTFTVSTVEFNKNCWN